MARPSAAVIISLDAAIPVDILEGRGVWALFYEQQPVALRQHLMTITGVRFKYPRTCFNNEAHCKNLAQRLNRQFKTDKFSSQQILVK